METNINNDDEIIENNGSKLVIDKLSLPYLDEAIIDFKESLIKSAFQVIYS